jgi:hypothetical protein
MKESDNIENGKMIPIKDEIDTFHQIVENNDRCILSAKFGDGKTYFLQQFQEYYKEDYLFVTIHPVNYQLAENYDIFDYLKRDILLNLLMTEGIEVDDGIMSKYLLLWGYFTENNYRNSFDLFDFIPDINVGAFNISIKSFVKNIKKIRDGIEQYRKKIDKIKMAEEFMNRIESKGIYEFDPISQLICDINDKYIETYKDKKIVLIIEDLDRIDPNHIFRILNIFSAQLDRENISPREYSRTNGKNKFKFDKVITVCDLENIKSIYHHLYGEGTDFNGYINKFSQDRAYRYSLKEKITTYILKEILDPEIRKYKKICHVLANLIIEKYTNKKQNLRSIKSYLEKTGTNIKRGLIPVRASLPNPIYSINLSIVNPLTKLLEIMRRFDIQDGIFNDKKLYDELKTLIGVHFLAILDAQYMVNTFKLLYGSKDPLKEPKYSKDYVFRLKKNTVISMTGKNLNTFISDISDVYIVKAVDFYKKFIIQ